MSSINRGRFARIGSGASGVLAREPKVPSVAVRNFPHVLAVALTAATLAACAQSSVVGNKSVSPAVSRQASSEPGRKASFVKPLAASKPAAATRDASYGVASYYEHGARTASGEKFNARELTAAHRTLPFGTRVRITNIATGRSVTVRVNDRGPFVPGRVIDVSQSAAETLGFVERGVAKVKLDVVR